ncbi:MAG: DEAD/DEAH box helicase [Brachybacterium sp.]|nr:DEAD/DEAH box helicase [Brachybacterium sp.]
MSSPSEMYADFRAQQRLESGPFGDFHRHLDFALDPFQVQACTALQDGRSVLVAAPTGAGKTVVGEFGVHLALARDRKIFYTAPIKALSNQKHDDLAAWLGRDRVGLLTGDVSINPDADVVVMTTEVLRNMLYADSPALEGLGYVVMDEVHYLADRLRGPVWEEVLIHLPASVQLISLSATVSNAEEFGAWLNEVRGDTAVIVSEVRPVPLWQHVLAGDELLDLFVDADGDPVVSHGPGASTERIVNPAVERLSALAAPVEDSRRSRGGRRDRRGPRGRHRPRGGRQEERRGSGGIPRPLRRPGVVSVLDDNALLPAICFIFSRTGCDAAVGQLVHSRLELTDHQERRTIRAVLDEQLATISHEDQEVLQIPAFRRAAERGFAAHHAGMLPLLKGIVEDLFSAGLIKVVFATETLALGINMPARSVMLEKLSKFNGVEHADLTPGEYTQLTGRAGRRGIDTEGHAVVLAAQGFDAEHVASLASRRTYPLRSAFRPTYNMTVNLLDRFDLQRSRETLEMSFAQYQSDRKVVGIARRARELEDTVAAYRDAAVCERGDVLEYAEIRQAITAREKELSQDRAGKDRDRTRAVLRDLRRGEILAIPGGRRQGYAVVTDVDRDVLGGPQVGLLGPDGRTRTVRPGDIPGPPAVIDRMKMPRPDRLSAKKVRGDTAAALRQKLSGHDDDPRREVRRRSPRTASAAAEDHRLQDLRARLAEHPCADCAELEGHLRWISRLRSTEKELTGLQRRIEGRTSSLARQFDRICALLAELGYLRAEGDDVVPTERGLGLRRLFSERDLLIAQCLEAGIWKDLDAPGLAALISAVSYESRRDDGGTPLLPEDPAVEIALAATERTAADLQRIERRHGLDPTPAPDAAIIAVMHRWASGEHFAAALGETSLPPGDFVRHCRQVIDLLGQLAQLPDIAPTARRAIDAVRRGFVSQEIYR